MTAPVSGTLTGACTNTPYDSWPLPFQRTVAADPFLKRIPADESTFMVTSTALYWSAVTSPAPSGSVRPACNVRRSICRCGAATVTQCMLSADVPVSGCVETRSEEHTSELQSRGLISY